MSYFVAALIWFESEPGGAGDARGDTKGCLLSSSLLGVSGFGVDMVYSDGYRFG